MRPLHVIRGTTEGIEPGIHFFRHSCGAMDSGFALKRAPE
jgi:hypothetical protein